MTASVTIMLSAPIRRRRQPDLDRLVLRAPERLDLLDRADFSPSVWPRIMLMRLAAIDSKILARLDPEDLARALALTEKIMGKTKQCQST